MSNHYGEVVTAGAKLAPPAVVTTASVAGITLENWVYLVTIVYVVLQIAFLLYRWGSILMEKENSKVGRMLRWFGSILSGRKRK